MPSNGFDVFISYARSASERLARDLQSGMERFAKPWNRLRAIRVFRDDTSMAANTALWSTIEGALRDAQWFVLLATPEAAVSEYVNNEVQWWLQNKSVDHLLVVHAGGIVRWDRQSRDFTADSDVPIALHGAYPEEPRWVDLSWFDRPPSLQNVDPRFAERVADLSAAVRGVERDILLSENVRQHRKVRRLTRASIAGLSVLLVLSLAAGVVALVQRADAVSQRNLAMRQSLIARAGQLAATAVATAPTDLPAALKLAATAYRSYPDGSTRNALHTTLSSAPELVDIINMATPVTALAVTPDGNSIAVVTADGKVVVHDRRTGDSEELMEIEQPNPTEVWISDNAQTVATPSKIWRAGTVTDEPVGALSPSGRSVASMTDANGVPRIAIKTDSATVLVPTSVASIGENHWLRFAGDRELVGVTMSGSVVRVSSTGQDKREFRVPLEAWMLGWGAISADGSRFAYATDSGNLEVVDISGVPAAETSPDSPLSIRTGGSDSEYLALNRNGTRAAVPAAGYITVSEVRPRGSTVPIATLRGAGQGEGLIQFASDNLMVSASKSQVLVWDLNSHNAFGNSAKVAFGKTCTACGPPAVAVSPDGTRAMIQSSDFSLVDLVSGAKIALPDFFTDRFISQSVWIDDRRALIHDSYTDEVFIVRGDNLGEVVRRIPNLPISRGQHGDRTAAVQFDDTVVAVLSKPGDNGKLVTIRPDQGAPAVSEHSATTVTSNGAYALNIRWDHKSDRTTADIIDAYEDRKTGSVEIDGSLLNLGIHHGSEILLLRVGRSTVDLIAVPTEGAHTYRDVAVLDARIALPGQVVSLGGSLLAERSGSIVQYDLATGEYMELFPVVSAAGHWNGLGVTTDGKTLVIANEPLQELVKISISPDDWERRACALLGRPVDRGYIESVIGSMEGILLACG